MHFLLIFLFAKIYLQWQLNHTHYRKLDHGYKCIYMYTKFSPVHFITNKIKWQYYDHSGSHLLSSDILTLTIDESYVSH